MFFAPLLNFESFLRGIGLYRQAYRCVDHPVDRVIHQALDLQFVSLNKIQYHGAQSMIFANDLFDIKTEIETIESVNDGIVLQTIDHGVIGTGLKLASQFFDQVRDVIVEGWYIEV